MKRMQFDSFGDPSVLYEAEVPTPVPGEGEVLVRSHAIGVNPFDWKFIAGTTGGSAEPAFPLVPGNEGAGVVETLGAGVTEFAVGDEVMWRTYLGGYATHQVVPVEKVYARPPSISVSEGATLAVAGGTAWSALHQVGVGPADTVLIHAASGGVGSAAVQIARSLGARVIGTASARNQDYVRSLGAEPVVYGEGLTDRIRALGTVTAVVDFAGTREAVEVTTELLPDLERAVTAVRGTGITPVTAAAAAIPAVIALAGDGALRLEITSEFPLAGAAAALELSRTGHVHGKIVLRA